MPIGRVRWVLVAGLVLASQQPTMAQEWVAQVFAERSHDFGTVARGSKLRHTFRVVNTTDQDLRIVDYRTKCGCTDVRLGAREIPPGTQTVVEATLDTTKFQGYKPSGLTLVVDGPSSVEVELTMTCFIRSDVTLSPGAVDFGIVPRASTPTTSLTLTYAGGRADWAVTRMETIGAAVRARLEEIGRSSSGQVQYRLTATLNPSSLPAGVFKDEITLFTNDPSSPKVPISVSANVQSGVTIAPSILNLGRLRPGARVQKTILVRSNRPFRVTEGRAVTGNLSVSPLDETPRNTHALTVTFTAPEQRGPSHAILELVTDVEDEPPAKLTAFVTVVP